MLKNILKLDGAQQLSKNEQKEISGGITKQCLDAYSNGCDRTITAVDCFSLYEGVYNSTCKCCNL
ncbi:hypothetical protein [Flavobacterium terrigena]|uniref:Uncharacterized protein n=1 Tax=Flavobacterium terrigena TaxID=402734 RepID=A0A1H6VNY0_9FLAO|nr:hypothetical protein [Flavobacterium terrigena]SEJ03457.1 hypothetical protein SAMN05660918_2222 [Flavobacterium terrigena]